MLNRERLLELCQCPACGVPLSEFAGCRGCGERFAEDTGTPCLMSANSQRTVTFEFAARNSVAEPHWLSECLVESPRTTSASRGSLPYHLDPNHAESIRGMPRGSLVLDIGCGGGQMRNWVVSIGHEYVGMDISKTRVQEWLQKHGGPDLLADAHFLPIRSSSVDAVYSSAVLEHVACPALFAQNAFRVLREGGLFMGSVSFLEPWHDDSFYHHSPYGLMETLRIGGFRRFTVFPGWSGHRAVLAMGNAFTRRIRALGGLVDLAYLGTDRLRNALGGMRSGRSTPMGAVKARVAGAFLWVAVR